jgi:hypothetical protein
VEKNCHQYFILCGSTSITFFDKYTDREPSREEYRHLQTLLTHFPPCSGSHGLPSLPCEGDYDQKWSDLGSVARFLSFSLLIFLFFLLLALRSNVSEPPPPPLSSPTFCFTSFSSDRVSYTGGSSLQRTLSLLSARLFLSSGRRDLLRPWMFGGHRVWGLLPVRDSVDYPIFGVDPSKLFFLKSSSPHSNRMASLAMANPIRLLSGLLGWDQGSKSSAGLDIGCCGCSCNLLDFGQALCRLVLLLLGCLLLLLLLLLNLVLFFCCSVLLPSL